MIGLNVLTHSRMQCRKACGERHHIAYQLGVRREIGEQPLRMGEAIHVALDQYAQFKLSGDMDAALEKAAKTIMRQYEHTPSWADNFKWKTEQEICLCLFYGYVWRWQDDDVEIVATEQAFSLPIVNPDTGRTSRNYTFAGKLDKIILWQAANAVMEHKTTDASLDPDSDYWSRLRIDTQISGYYLAANELGYDVRTVVYDVIRKPGIRPLESVPCTDEHNRRIIIDSNGQRMFKASGEPYLSADPKKGRFAQSRPETIQEFGDRLIKDIRERPDFYYARREIPRLGCDIHDFRRELWSIQQSMKAEENNGWHFRNSDACLKPYPCPYREPCWNGWNFEGGPPEGFTVVKNVHPELGEHYADSTATKGTTENAAQGSPIAAV